MIRSSLRSRAGQELARGVIERQTGFAVGAGLAWYHSTMFGLHRHHHGDHGHGATIRWARLYDIGLRILTGGREARFRERMLDAAGVSTGQRVLDVGSGTGTLALAARRRVGANGSVDGIDAAKEMVARARAKAARARLDATFSVAAAQALPFADRAFDVVLCTLVLHHLPAEDRARSIAEMRRVLAPGGRLLVVDFAVARELLEGAGFTNVTSGRLAGWRVLHWARGTA